MTERRILRARRQSEIRQFDVDGVSYIATVSRFSDGELAEIFLDGPKIGSAAQIAARDAAICASLCLQLGIGAEALLHSLERNHRGEPRGPLGKAIALFEYGGT